MKKVCVLILVLCCVLFAVSCGRPAADGPGAPNHHTDPSGTAADTTAAPGSGTAGTTQSGVPSGSDAQTTTETGGSPSTSFQTTNPAPSSGESQPTKPTVPTTSTTPDPGPNRPTAQELLSRMTLEEKIGQLFIVQPEALNYNLRAGKANASGKGVTAVNDDILSMLSRYPVGGVALFGNNLSSPSQLSALISSLQLQSEVPLFMAVDEEGGRVARIANSAGFNVPKYESMLAIGSTGDPQKAYGVGTTIGSYLKRYGFNLNFAPVADVFTNPENTVIGDRSFGSDPALVAKMVAAEIAGLHKAGIMSCVKHFPGHGDTKDDTHDGFVAVDKTWDELKSCEMLPFIGAIEAGADMIMVSHISVPRITSDGLPASLSGSLLNDRLRKELGYDGVIITDALAMGAITQHYSSGEAAVKAVLAGVDILLMPKNLIEAYDAVHNAVKNGTISQQRLDESVLRILLLKEKYLW